MVQNQFVWAVAGLAIATAACVVDPTSNTEPASGGAGGDVLLGSGGSGPGGAGAAGGGGGGSGGVGGAGGEPGSCPSFVQNVVDTSFGPGQTHGQNQLPGAITGPPSGEGCCAGSLDVVSLGDGGSITVDFGDASIVDGPGPDLVVFENAFYIGGDENQVFAEPGIVEVSEDGEQWYAFDCDVDTLEGCAGTHPVFANPSSNAIDPLDPEVSGGDLFDLASLRLSSARFVRITDHPDDGINFVFDLDGVGIIHGACER